MKKLERVWQQRAASVLWGQLALRHSSAQNRGLPMGPACLLPIPVTIPPRALGAAQPVMSSVIPHCQAPSTSQAGIAVQAGHTHHPGGPRARAKPGTCPAFFL